jgi:ribonuclease T1
MSIVKRQGSIGKRMPHIVKKMFLNAVVMLSFVNFTGAAQTVPSNDSRATSAVELLAGVAPSISLLERIAAQKVEPAPLVVVNEKAIAPGRDLAPKVNDPARVKAVLKLVGDIYNNAHLPYAQDGAVFKNKEGQLPVQPVGFYREYTLLTGDAPHTVVIDGQTYQVAPDLSARGSERVIIGGGESLYYTPDHYKNFIQLTVVR